jgi:pterin-4a-carbinolamine dehydratase
MRKIKSYTLFQIVLVVIGLGIGTYFSHISHNSHKAKHESSGSHSTMCHGNIEVGLDSLVPKIEQLEILKDPVSGWNLHIETTNFKFTPENVNSAHKSGEGHAHLMINGNKIARVYSNWFHIPELDCEINELEVTLNANTHSIMTVNGNSISLTLSLRIL